MASSVTPPGWRLTVTNGTRRAIDPNGNNVSYGQYLNAQARQSGFKSHSDYRKYAKDVAKFRKGGAKPALGSDLLKRIKEQFLTPVGKGDKSARGVQHRLLVDLGMRDADATYDVGDTPGEE